MPLNRLRLQVVLAAEPGLGVTPLDGNGTAVWQTVPSVAGEEVRQKCEFCIFIIMQLLFPSAVRTYPRTYLATI